MRLGWHGPSETVTTACAAGTHAIGHAARLVASGRCDVAIGGAAEAGMTAVGIAAFANMTALSTSGISRPFDVRRDGFVITEGAGALVLEDWDRAVARGARIYAELAGVGQHRRRPPHHRPASRAAPARSPAWSWPWTTPAIDARADRATSTPTAPRRPSTTWPRPRPSQGVRRARPAGHLDQGRHRARPRRRRRHRGGGRRCSASSTPLIPPTAGYEQPDPEIHLDIVHGEARPVGARPRSCPTPSASAATTAAW